MSNHIQIFKKYKSVCCKAPIQRESWQIRWLAGTHHICTNCKNFVSDPEICLSDRKIK